MPRTDYQFVKLIGAGSFGQALLFRSNKDNKEYVIKKMDMNDPDVRDLAEAECERMRQLKHEYIVAYKEFFIDSGYMHLVMEYCACGDLDGEIKSCKQNGLRFEEDQIVEWTLQICLGLEYLHDNNTIHRDLKPPNVFLSSTKQIKIGDFGIARTLNPGDLASTLCGSPLYFSPELLANQPYDNRVDVWSLGCVVYEVMTFRAAVDPLILLALQHIVVHPMPTNYSAALTKLTRDMLTVDPRNRPTVTQLLQCDLLKKQLLKRSGSKAGLPTHSPSVHLDTLAKNGLTFNHCGKLVDVKNGQMFKYDEFPDKHKNEQRYQAVAQSVTHYIQERLVTEFRMQKIQIPLDAKSGEACSFIYATQDWKTNAERLLVLIQGNGAPRAGEWARKVVINDSMDAGSMIPWVKRGLADGYAVLLLNPNQNSQFIGGKEIPVKGSEDSGKHVKYVWKHIITASPAKKVAVVAHSSGGDHIMDVALDNTNDFLKTVSAVAFTDSCHNVGKHYPEKLTSFLNKRCRHWASSDLPLDTPLPTTPASKYDAPKVSAGDSRHEWTTWSSFSSVFQFLNSQLR